MSGVGPLALRALKAKTLLRLGIRNLWWAAIHRLRMKAGWYAKKAPTLNPPAEHLELETLWPRRACPPALPAENLDRIEKGMLLFFSHDWRPIPEGWTGAPSTEHWSRLSQQSGAAQVDLKDRWEAGRFDWVYMLTRAHSEPGDRAEELFWRLFVDWRGCCPPHLGHAWLCAQETSIRGMALLWAAGAFQLEGDRRREIARVAALSAERVEPSLIYALAQNNNHGLSEAAFLYLAGLALPAHPRSARWKAEGRKWLERQVREQIAPDGGYVLHSMNYHRYVVRLLTMVVLAAQNSGETPSRDLTQRLEASARFLLSHLNPSDGRVPNYGTNDGSNVFKLDATPYLDYRGTIEAALLASTGRRAFPDGPWTETSRRLFADPLPAWDGAPEQASIHHQESGHLILRAPEGMAFMRCHTYRARPGQADSLHVDLWHKGRSIARDSGSYRYYDPRGWDEHFKSTAGQNTVEVEGQSQMISGGQFLFIDWLKARVLEFSPDRLAMEGEHDGYVRRFGVTHRRRVSWTGEGWRVEDTLMNASDAARRLSLRWRLDAALDWTWSDGALECEEARVSLAGTGEFQARVLRHPEDGPETCESLLYAQATPVVLLRADASVPARSTFRWTTEFRLR